MRIVLVGLLLVAGGCPAPKGTQRPYPEPTVADLVSRLTKARDALTSFRADSTMDYWLGSQRAKGEVLVMGQVGAKVRFAALSPAGGSSMAEMACDGTNFVYVDYQNNCALTGPCDQRSIAAFFHIELAPDDFLHLAVGTPPIVATAGKVTYVGGHELLELSGPDGTEKLTIDLNDHHLDVVAAELIGSDGKTKWSVTNAEFLDVGGHRVPGKSQFKSPANQQDLIVEWGASENRAVNLEPPTGAFDLQAPPGLTVCGSK